MIRLITMQDFSSHSSVIVSLIMQLPGLIFVNIQNLLHYK